MTESPDTMDTRVSLCEHAIEGIPAALAVLGEKMERLIVEAAGANTSHALLEQRVALMEKQVERVQKLIWGGAASALGLIIAAVFAGNLIGG